jgi:hypothetical protein
LRAIATTHDDARRIENHHPLLKLSPQKQKEKTLLAQLAQVEGLADNAPLSVNSWLAVFMKYPLIVSGIYTRPKPDSP